MFNWLFRCYFLLNIKYFRRNALIVENSSSVLSPIHLSKNHCNKILSILYTYSRKIHVLFQRNCKIFDQFQYNNSPQKFVQLKFLQIHWIYFFFHENKICCFSIFVQYFFFLSVKKLVNTDGHANK